MNPLRPRHCVTFLLATLFSFALTAAQAQPVEAVLSLAQKERAPLLETLEGLCNIESGSRDIEGLEKLAELIASRLKTLGGEVQLVDGNADAYRMEDTPEHIGKAVRA